MRESPFRHRPPSSARWRSVAGRLAVASLAAAFVFVGVVPAIRPAVAAASSIKVVVIVGPVEGLTDSYRKWAEKVAQTAASYGADVRRVYSPNATWKKVLDNIQDASIVVYMGHGNGFPSPYSSTLNPDKVDGFGLNDPNNLSDDAHVYRGESYIASSVKLAPNAVVFLSHACYAPGASESWDKDPTADVARQRSDNFAAGFIKAGARAVFALSHDDPSPYVAKILDRNLTSADTTMQEIFETTWRWDGSMVKRFGSVRSPGFDQTLDPTYDSKHPAWYIRSLVTWPGLTTGQVTGYDPAAPRLQSFGPQPAYLSPNADGVKDAVTFSGTWTAPTDWRLQVQDQAGATLFTSTGSGTTLSVAWGGEDQTTASDPDSTGVVPDGTYRVVVDGQDGAGHVSSSLNFTAMVDTAKPVITAPVPRLYATKLGSSSTPVKTSWSSSSTSPVSYRLQRQVNGGSWSTLSASTTSTTLSQSLAFGSTYRYRVAATDAAGNASGYVYSSSFKPLLTQQSSSAASYAAKWYTSSATSYSGGSARYSKSAGASASFTFTGASVGWVASKGPTRGSADVYIDGVWKKTVSLHASSYKSKRLVYAYNWSSNGGHTIKIVVRGTAGHPRVDVDAFVRLYRV